MRAAKIAAVLIIVVCLSGCAIMPVGLTSSARLAKYGTEAAQAQMTLAQESAVQAKADAAKIVAAAEAEVKKIRDSKPTATWPFYLVGALAMVGGLALGYWLKKIALGFLLVVGGASLLGWVRFLEQYPWAFWIPFGLGIVAGAYFLWDYYRASKDQAQLPVVETAVTELVQGAQNLKAGVLSGAEAMTRETANKILAAAQSPLTTALVKAVKEEQGL
jgi:vacuolar-type H+-ATPase subunit H